MGFDGLPERLQHVQRFQLADLLALDQTDARMGNSQELNIGVLSRTLWWNEDKQLNHRVWTTDINIILERKKRNTYGNGIETGEIERPFFGHLDNVALERNFVMTICGVLWRDAVIFQHLLKWKQQQKWIVKNISRFLY